MDMNSLIRVVPALYDSSVEKGQNAAILLLGPMGHAKTSVGRVIAATLARHTGRPYESHVSQPMLEPYDEVRGITVPQRDEEGHLIASYAWPGVLPPRERLMNSVWVLDEITKAPEENILALANAVLSGTLGDAVIPKETFIVGTGNRAGIDQSMDKRMPAHALSRFYLLHWKLTLRSWKPWALAQGVHPLMMAYASQREDRVFAGSEPKRNEAFLCPRSLTEVDALMRSWIDLEGRTEDSRYFPIDNPDLQELIAGKVGASAAVDLAAYAAVGHRLPQWDDIVSKPSVAAVPDIGGDMGPPALHAVACMVAAKLTADVVAQVVKYMRRIPDEYAVPVWIRLANDYPGEAAAAGLVDLLIDNQDLTEACMIFDNSR